MASAGRARSGSLVLFGVLGLVLAVSGLGNARSAAGSSLSNKPRAMTCAGTTVVKPASYTIACADANSYLTKLHWTTWVAKGASAQGTFTENTCTPYCAAGKFVSHPATIALSQAKQTKHGYLFTRLVVTYRAGGKTEHLSTTLPTAPLS